MKWHRWQMILLLDLALYDVAIRAEGMEPYEKNAAIGGVVSAIQNLNEAMRNASKNPENEQPRREVPAAVRALGASIQALALDYQNVKLDPEQFPQVWKQLAGMIDQNAPRAFFDLFEQKEVKQLETEQSGKIQPSPKYWRMVPLKAALSFFPAPEGHAEEIDIAGIVKAKGEAIAMVLMGIAAMITAAAPMVVAGIQAKADTKIAEIHAMTQVKTTQITANTSKVLANQQKNIALEQARIAQAISKQNNDAQSQRLDSQLAELRDAREGVQKAEQERREIEMSYNSQRIELARQQAADNLSLAKQTLNANLVQAGLVSGTQPINSANAVTANTIVTSPAATSSASGAQAKEGGATLRASAGTMGASALSEPQPSAMATRENVSRPYALPGEVRWAPISSEDAEEDELEALPVKQTKRAPPSSTSRSIALAMRDPLHRGLHAPPSLLRKLLGGPTRFTRREDALAGW